MLQVWVSINFGIGFSNGGHIDAVRDKSIDCVSNMHTVTCGSQQVSIKSIKTVPMGMVGLTQWLIQSLRAEVNFNLTFHKEA